MLHSSSKINFDKPKSNEFEISIFGPGIGECLVLHLGRNKWLVVDSCLHPKTKKPIALEYLRNIGIDPAHAVELLIVTHWHADHIKGASQIIIECPETRFCYPAALLQKEFLSFVSAYSGADIKSIVDRNSSSTREFESIIINLKKNCDANERYKNEHLSPIFNNTLIFEENNDDFDISIRSLSPSNKSYHDSILMFASMIPDVKQLRTVVPLPKPNNNSVVLWVQVNDMCLLLGGDLEETRDPDTGWSAIVDSSQRPSRRAKFFKIPHHGSENGHSDGVWKNMIDESPVSILTSKIGGRGPIPKEKDIKRIKQYSQDLFCTNVPKGIKIKRDNTVEKMIKSTVKSRHILNGDVGHIQVRFSNSEKIEVNCQHPATAI